MKKIIFSKTNILLFLLVATLVLMIIILLQVKVTSVKENLPDDKPIENIVIDREEYKRNILSALDEYDQVVSEAGLSGTSTKQITGGNDLIFQRIDNLKNKIVEIKAPSTEYKDLHMNLVLSLLSIKDYLELPATKKSVVCIESVKKVKKSQELLLD